MRRFFQTRLFQQVLVPASGGDFNLALSDGGTLPVSTQTAGGGGGGVTAVTGTAPITSTGGATPAIGITPSAPANTLSPGANGQVVTTVGGASVWATPAAAGPGSAGYVIFRPGTASAGQAVATPAELNTAAANGAVTLIVDSSIAAATLPAGFTLDPRFIVAMGFATGFPGFSGDLLTLADTAKWGVYYVDGLDVICDCATTGAWTFAAGNTAPVVLIDNSAAVRVPNTATAPLYKAPSGVFAQFTVRGNSQLLGGTGAPAISAASGGTIELLAYEESTVTATALGSDVGGEALYAYDASMVPPTFTFMHGTYAPTPVDSDQNMTYGEGTAFPSPPNLAQPFFRTDLEQEYRWNGTIWLASSSGPGATRTVTALAAAAYTTAFLQALSVTPATFPGTPIAAFNVTPTQTGLLELSGEVLVNPTSAELPAYEVVIIAGSSSAGVAGGVNTLLGDTANPLTVPGGAQTHIGRFSGLGVASIAQTSLTLACQGQVAVGTAVTVVVYASSQSGTNAWTFSANLRVYERSLN
jgi:hypothetical protein